MKKYSILLLALLISFACSKEEESEPEPITKVEYRILTSYDGAMIKYLDAKGEEVIDFLEEDVWYVQSFKPEIELDSAGFKIKDYVTWVEYKVVVNSDTVINHLGTVPDGNEAGWYNVFHHF